jgi:RNA polymerase sigma factor (sigma-70 family)
VAARSAEYDEGRRGHVDFQNLVEVQYAPLYRFAMSLTHTEHDAADLVQDTFLAWAAKGHQLLDRSKVKTWLFTTLHRRFLERQRRIARFPHCELTEAETELPNVQPELMNQLDAQRAVDLLAQVDPQYRAAVALFYLEDYSYQEIATILEVPIGTIKSRIARGLGQLKALMLRHSPSAQRAAGEDL